MNNTCITCGKAMIEKPLFTSTYWECPSDHSVPARQPAPQGMHLLITHEFNAPYRLWPKSTFFQMHRDFFGDTTAKLYRYDRVNPELIVRMYTRDSAGTWTYKSSINICTPSPEAQELFEREYQVMIQGQVPKS